MNRNCLECLVLPCGSRRRRHRARHRHRRAVIPTPIPNRIQLQSYGMAHGGI